MTFARPDLLPLVLILPAALALLVGASARRRRSVAARLGDAGTVARLGGASLLRFPGVRLALLLGAGAAVALAAAGPRWGRRVVSGPSEALNLVLALDVSKSMLADDILPNRLEHERVLVRRLLRELAGDRFGLVAFAGRAYVLSPVTSDHGAIELYLDGLDPGIVSQGGTSLQSALLQATDLARGVNRVAGDLAIVLITDGEALEDESGVLQAAGRAAAAGVRVFAGGIGTAGGAAVPDVDPGSGTVIGYKRDEEGTRVRSRLNEPLLRKIAERTDGAYLSMAGGDAVGWLADRLGRLERGAVATERRTEPVDRFYALLLMALALLAMDVVLAHRSVQRSGARGPGRVTGLLLLVLLLAGFGIGDLERGNRLYRAGRYAEAVAAYREALGSGPGTPVLHYNLGTALLRLGRYREAEQEFGQALSSVEPQLREPTLYNLGTRYLLEGRQGGASLGSRLDDAIAAYRQALRIDPHDAQAKWNLELALRERARQQQRRQEAQSREQGQEPQQGTGGGGGQPEAAGEHGQAGAEQPQPMTQAQAERILDAAEQDERDLARAKLHQGRPGSATARDW